MYPPNNDKVKKLDTIIEPLCKELKEKKEHFPVTIVYVENLESLGYFYKRVKSELNDNQYPGKHVPENRQFHKDYTEAMKTYVITELKKENPTLRLIFATVALGMGLDARCNTGIIHCSVDLLQQLKNISKKSEEPAELETSVLRCYILTIKTLQKQKRS